MYIIHKSSKHITNCYAFLEVNIYKWKQSKWYVHCSREFYKHMTNCYSFAHGEHITEESQNDLFIIHESSKYTWWTCIMFSKWSYKWRESEWFVHCSREFIMHIINFYPSLQNEHITEENQHDFFIGHDNSNIHSELLFVCQTHEITE